MNVLAVADDLSGATEVAGVAWRMGMNVSLVTRMSDARRVGADVVVANADSRSVSREEAEEIWRSWAECAGEMVPRLFYKKTDSVLRGHLAAELEVCLKVGPWSRALVVPANPERGRLIRDGLYRIADEPLERTEFARDPAFPLRTSLVAELLAGSVSAKVGEEIDGARVIIGDTESADDLRTWAGLENPELLRAGASPFFAELLRGMGGTVRRKPMQLELPDTGGTWLVSGSASHRARSFTERLERDGWPATTTNEHGEPSPNTNFLVVRHPRNRQAEPPAVLTKRLADKVEALLRSRDRPLPHLCLEGGETAAATLEALGGTNLSVLREWEPGVVALDVDGLLVTIKPGSYPWPPFLFET